MYGWRLAIQAAPSVAALLRQEFGWSTEQEDAAVNQYVSKVNHMLVSAGQEAEPLPVSARELTLQRS
jgi:hypothetical protein